VRSAMRAWNGPAAGITVLLALIGGCAGLGSYPFELPYVEQDACPFECCTYGEWTASAPLYVTGTPDVDATVLREVAPGETFTALGGSVYVLEPGTAVVREGRNRFAAGEHLWVFSYVGEGVWNVWYEGNLVEVPMLQDPAAKGDPEQPAVVLEKPPRTRWWVEIQDEDGNHGWILMDPRDLRVTGADACE